MNMPCTAITAHLQSNDLLDSACNIPFWGLLGWSQKALVEFVPWELPGQMLSVAAEKEVEQAAESRKLQRQERDLSVEPITGEEFRAANQQSFNGFDMHEDC